MNNARHQLLGTATGYLSGGSAYHQRGAKSCDYEMVAADSLYRQQQQQQQSAGAFGAGTMGTASSHFGLMQHHHQQPQQGTTTSLGNLPFMSSLASEEMSVE